MLQVLVAATLFAIAAAPAGISPYRMPAPPPPPPTLLKLRAVSRPHDHSRISNVRIPTRRPVHAEPHRKDILAPHKGRGAGQAAGRRAPTRAPTLAPTFVIPTIHHKDDNTPDLLVVVIALAEERNSAVSAVISLYY